jgi:hypothetical protein
MASTCSSFRTPAATAFRSTGGPVQTIRADSTSLRAVPTAMRYRPRNHAAVEVAPCFWATSTASMRCTSRSFNPASCRSAVITASSVSTDSAGSSGHSGSVVKAPTASAIAATR